MTDTRETIMAFARATVQAHGYNGLSFRELAKAVGVVRRRGGEEGDEEAGELEVVEIVRYKICFTNRPEPVEGGEGMEGDGEREGEGDGQGEGMVVDG